MSRVFLVVAVNDRTDELRDLATWATAANIAVADSLATAPIGSCVVLLSDYWLDGGRADFIAGLLAWVNANRTNSSSPAILFLCDNLIRGVYDTGVRRLVDIFTALKMDSPWWAALLSEGDTRELLDLFDQQAYMLDPIEVARHFLGCSSRWQDNAISLITQLSSVSLNTSDWQGWMPRLNPAISEGLRAAAHSLANIALPLDLDLAKFRTLSDETARNEHLALLRSDYLAREDSYLVQKSAGDDPGLYALLSEVETRLVATPLPESARSQVRQLLDNVRTTVDTLVPGESVARQGVASGEMLSGLEAVLKSLQHAEAGLRTLANQVGGPSYEAQTPSA